MKIGISTRVFSCETEDALEKIERSGADCSDIYLRTFYEYRPEFSKALKKGAEGTKIASIRTECENFELNLLSPDRRIRGDGLYWLDQVLEQAKGAGAKRLVFSFSHLSGRADDADLSYVVNACAAYGIEPCVANAASGLVSRRGDFSALKKKYPAFKGALDLSEARRARFPYLIYIKDMGESLDEVFVSDFSLEGPCLPGEGTTDFSELFKRLSGEGFCGDVAVDSSCGADVERAKDCVEHLRDMAEKAGI